MAALLAVNAAAVAPAAGSCRSSASGARMAHMRCFMAAPRGVAVQHRAALVAARAEAPTGRGGFAAAEDEEQYEQDDRFQERVVQVRDMGLWAAGGGGAERCTRVAALRGLPLQACAEPCAPPWRHQRRRSAV